MELDLIKQFSISTREDILLALRSFDRQAKQPDGLKRAAVAVVIIPFDGQAGLVLTKRLSTLSAHGGQWSFPGGRLDDGETAEDAAFRELEEEVGLSRQHAEVLGLLDDFETRSGYLITPVVLWANYDMKQLVANEDEVESIHAISFSELARTDSPRLDYDASSEQPVLSMYYGDTWIYAPTGAILYQFRELALFKRNTRVAHYEQPRFAWK
ncbi:MAG: CoA pyrophosphatase [Pseudomonadota bacterium]